MPSQEPIDFSVPSPVTLAGIYVCVEEEEDLTIRPKQIEPQQLPPTGANAGVQQSSKEITIDLSAESAQRG